jgi:hypothetical protein
MKMDEIEITGPMGGANCLATTLGEDGRIWVPGKVAISRAELDQICHDYGWIDRSDGDVEIGIWVNDHGITHVSRILPGNRHESKLGVEGPRVIHSADDLRGSDHYAHLRLEGTKKGRLPPPDPDRPGRR